MVLNAERGGRAGLWKAWEHLRNGASIWRSLPASGRHWRRADSGERDRTGEKRGNVAYEKSSPGHAADMGRERSWQKTGTGPKKGNFFSGKVRSPQLGAIDGETGRGFGKWICGSGKRRKMTVRARIGALYIPIKNSKSISRGSSWPIRDGLSLARLPAPVGVCRACRGLRRSVF